MFKILAVDLDSICLLRPMTSLINKSPCLLELPTTSLECSASFFGLFLASVYGGQFLNQQSLSALEEIEAGKGNRKC